jgi:hypothetical protein
LVICRPLLGGLRVCGKRTRAWQLSSVASAERWKAGPEGIEAEVNIFEGRMVSSGLLRRVALVRTYVSEEPGASIIRVTKIGELGTTQAATSNRRTLRRNWYFFAAYVGC